MKLSDVIVDWRPIKCPVCGSRAKGTFHKDTNIFAGRTCCGSCGTPPDWMPTKYPDPEPLGPGHSHQTPQPKKTMTDTIKTLAARTAHRFHTIARWLSPFVMCLAIFATPACGLFEDGGALSWPKVAQCGPNAEDLFGVVSRIILEDRGEKALGDHAVQQLEELARTKGTEAVVCVADLLVKQWLAPGASPDPARVEAAHKAQHFLDARGVEQVQH